MQRIFTARTELEAHDVRFFLESQGIRAVVIGESVAFTNFSFTPTSEPSVVVEDADAEHAIELLKTSFASRPTIEARGDWKCTNCGDSNGEAFELCWNCAAPRSDDALSAIPEPSDDEPSDDEPPASSGESRPVEVAAPAQPPPLSIERAWLEVAILFAIMLPWPLTYWFFDRLELAWGITNFASQWAFSLTAELLWASCALAIVWQSGAPWSRFGLQPLRPLMDLFNAGIITIVAAFAAGMSNGLLYDLARGWLHPDYLEYLLVDSNDWIRAEGGSHAFLLLILSLSIGFTEELIFRGILIPRFEQILGSTFFSVLASSLLFGLVHWDQGVLFIWNAFGMGLIFGTLFAKYRNLWPLVFAHSLLDFSIFLRQNSY